MTKNEIYQNNDELDLMELLEILLREKKIVIITFIIIFLVALGGALFERNRSKEALGIININISKLKNFSENDLLPMGVLEKIYKENKVGEKNEISLDKFRSEFKVKGIIPKDIEEKKEKYIPNNYSISLRVGDISESENILNSYYKNLQEYYMDKYETKYNFNEIPLDILNNKNYEYLNYISIIEKNKNNMESILKNKVNSNLNYGAYGFGYREIDIALENLENIKIKELKEYLISTNIVRNVENFKDQYISKRDSLLNAIESKEKIGLNYKNLLKNAKIDRGNVVLPKGTKIQEGNDNREGYYVDLMESYLKNQLEIEKLKDELNLLEEKNNHVKKSSKEENTFIINRLKNIILGYNEIVLKGNILENRENYIENGGLVKLGNPVVIVSNSKAKLILGGGVILGVFLGIAMAFLKNFMGEFKKGKHHQLLSVLVLCCLVGYKGYGQEILKVTYTQNELEKGLNPDGSLFSVENSIKNNFLRDKLKLDEKELENIKITPIVLKGSYKIVENRIINGENFIYVPSEYKVILDLSNRELEKKVTHELINNYPKFYINYYLDREEFGNKIDYVNKYDTYRESLEAFNNLIKGLESEVKNRKNSGVYNETKYEYNNINIKLERLKNMDYMEILNYLNSKNIVKNSKLEKILLKGEMELLERKVKNYGEVGKIYKNILNEYDVPKSSVVLLENGDISINGSSNLREKEYINISKRYLEILNTKNILERKLKENKKLYDSMTEGNEKEKTEIKGMFLNFQNNINSIIESMERIELKNYYKEYRNSVKVTSEKN